MILRVGYIPYLNMAPFHKGFGPQRFEKNGVQYEFPVCTPRTLGMEAEQGRVDAGALSLVDSLRLAGSFEPLGQLGIGVKGPAQSVLVFSKKPFSELSGVCAVTDETATSVRLLEMLLAERYHRPQVHLGRIASSLMFDGDADALLLIGDEALQAKAKGIPGFSHVTDLGSEWLAWQGTPFVFARWMVRRSIDLNVKHELLEYIEKALASTLSTFENVPKESEIYWSGFDYRLTSEHDRSLKIFEKWVMARA
jgi:chorismate dehydratase